MSLDQSEKLSQMVSTMHTQAKQFQLEKDFQQACDIYSTLLVLMEEQCNSDDLEKSKISVDYASALIDNYIDEKLNAAKKDNEAIVQRADEENEESDNSYGDDPILGNPVIIKTNIEHNSDDGDNGDADNKHDPATSSKKTDQDDDASDIEIAWEILEVARLNFEKNPDDKSCIHYLIKTRNLIALIYKENENPEESLRESFECKQLYKTHDICDHRLYADICYNRAFCYLLLMDSKLAVMEYREAIKALESIINNTDLTDVQIKEIQDIIDGIRAQMKMCIESNIDKDSIKNNIREFIHNWSNVPAETSKSNSLNATSQLKPQKREHTDAADISHLVKKKKE